ncbi:MAG: hypothetical protein UV43_C0068G0005 [Parcubacteria group bacterium GW2011_GWF2_42_7]|nr:MAG: hypothetical protein UV43_C0068G0005 [Parcubacteria group bacterium GW2011_GWF2_42_7]
MDAVTNDHEYHLDEVENDFEFLKRIGKKQSKNFKRRGNGALDCRIGLKKYESLFLRATRGIVFPLVFFIDTTFYPVL